MALIIALRVRAAFSLFITVVCHPAKLARVILLTVCSAVSAILCLLPIPHIRYIALRSGGAWLGAMGVIVSISVLSRVSDWADAWARLWVNWDSHWGTSQEKGLSAAFAILAALGIATDWLLKRQFGECPDEVRIDSFSYLDTRSEFYHRNGTTIWRIMPPISPTLMTGPAIFQLHFHSGRRYSTHHRKNQLYSHQIKLSCLLASNYHHLHINKGDSDP